MSVRPPGWVAIPMLLVLLSNGGAAQEISPAASWELTLLGIDGEDQRELAALEPRRLVRLAIVGADGVSAEVLGELLADNGTLIYHDSGDPRRNTHDTQMTRVILELTSALGVTVELHSFQAGPAFSDVADKMRAAAGCCDLVSIYQSYWGRDAALITAAIRESPQALFVSPYVEYQGRPTGNAPQGSAYKPWDEASIAHFITVAPLARRGEAGRITTVSERGADDTEAITFLAPSYHANGPGGTCPSAAVAVACLVSLMAISPEPCSPAELIGVLHRTADLDEGRLTAVAELDHAALERLAQQVDAYAHPTEGHRRRLVTAGVLNLRAAVAELTTPNDDVGD